MELIREPFGVDLVVDPRPLTVTEEFLLNEYIKNDRLARAEAEKKQPQYVVQEESAVYQRVTKQDK